jgi:membrane-associated protease RseP (regulator of RpoE activity)
MKTKLVLSLPVIIILSAGIALAQQSPAPPRSLDSDDNDSQDVFTWVENGGYLGVYAEDINRENMARYNLNQVRGVGVTRIIKDSPAEKAGLKHGDVILRIDGEKVTSVRKLNRVVSEIAPEQSVRVTISRGGAEQEVAATIGRRNNTQAFKGLLKGNADNWEWEGPTFENNNGNFTFAFAGGRRIGISTTELTKQLADYFGVTGGKGVLITSVSDDGPAAKAGLKAGDVITSVDGEPVESSGDVSRMINHKKDGEVTLTIIRNKAQQTIRVTPVESGLRGGTIGRPQIGRRIVIPRIEIGTIPEINISMPEIQMPQIQIPTIPSIDIQMPRIKVPTVRVIRTSRGPI